MQTIHVTASIGVSPCKKYCDPSCEFFSNGKEKKCKLFKALLLYESSFISRCVDCINAEQAAIIDAENQKIENEENI